MMSVKYYQKDNENVEIHLDEIFHAIDLDQFFDRDQGHFDQEVVLGQDPDEDVEIQEVEARAVIDRLKEGDAHLLL